jgi:hypothetical protein
MSEACEPANKKIRSSEPDLVVMVGDEQKEYHYHSQVMATHSKVIDTMLSASMIESQTRRINFPDLNAKVWESMIYFLDPATSRQMTVQDALQIAAAYDQYEFRAGAECCDQVFCELFGKIMPDGHYGRDEKPDDLNQLIDAFLLADAANLKQSKKRAVQYFKGALNSVSDYGRIIFCENQIKKLVPLIVKEHLFESLRFTKDKILESRFPEHFVTSCSSWETGRMLDRAIPGLKLSGTGCKADGRFTTESFCREFESNRSVCWGGVDLSIKISRLTDDWVIY